MLELVLQTFTLPPLHQQEAWFWIPFTILFEIIFIWWLRRMPSEPLKGTKLGVLGMPGSGKTQFLMNLRGIEYKSYQQTNVDRYQSFIFSIDGRDIKIKEGHDIGGGEYNIKRYYKEFLIEKDCCIFLFDIQKYMDKKEYREQTNARLDFINNNIIKHNEFALIATHIDKIKADGKETLKQIHEMVAGLPYERLFKTNFYPCNLLDNQYMDFLKKKLFIQE